MLEAAIVDPKARTVECYGANNGKYTLTIHVSADEVLGHPDFPGLNLEMKTIWTVRRRNFRG